MHCDCGARHSNRDRVFALSIDLYVPDAGLSHDVTLLNCVPRLPKQPVPSKVGGYSAGRASCERVFGDSCTGRAVAGVSTIGWIDWIQCEDVSAEVVPDLLKVAEMLKIRPQPARTLMERTGTMACGVPVRTICTGTPGSMSITDMPSAWAKTL